MGDGQRQKVRNMNNIERTTTGMPQFIVTQDRNRIYPMKLINLHSEIKEKDGEFYGINLLMDVAGKSALLGTFDTVEQVIHEINELYNTNLEIYCISGFDKDRIIDIEKEFF